MTKKILPSRAYYIDTFAQQSTHEMVNSSLMIMCSLVFDCVICNVSRTSYLAFKNLVINEPPTNITFNHLYVIGGESRFKLFLRYIIGAIQNVIFLVKSPKDAILIFPFNNLFSLRLINFLNKIFKRRIVIFCHSELEGIITDLKGLGYLHKILAKLCKNFFLDPRIIISDGLYFSVMGDILKENLLGVVSSDKLAKFISIDHPYIFKDDVNKNKHEDSLFSIGTVGTFSKLKGLNTFIAFITKIKLSIREKLRISITGKVSGDLELLRDLKVDMVGDNKGLSRKEFDFRVQNLDLILFFYPKSSYKITASGAIFDAILHEKPILALKNDYFDYIFKKFGNFGYLETDTDGMVDKLYELMETRIMPDINFTILKNKFTPANLSLQLAHELSRIGFLTI